VEELVAEKKANALIADAQTAYSGATHGVLSGVIEAFRKRMGGLWVGGTASLYETKLVFRPNRLNRAVHAAEYSVEVPLASVTDVRVRRAILTKIVDVTWDSGTLSIRCFGADGFDEAIRRQIGSRMGHRFDT
jgi:hypothetical protein